jgi:TetR/AcrR family transcriptional repressor of nem operon
MARPLEHNREDVIAAAMQVFWDKGYSATSMSDLKIATGLNPGSLYASYQSKEDLFISTLEFYCDQSISNIEKTLLADETHYIDNIYTFFKNFLKKNDNSDKGCFFVNTLIEMSPHNPRVKTLLETYTNRYKSTFSIALTRAKEKGQISTSTDIDTKSSQLMLTIWGLRVMQRSGINTDTKLIVKQQLDGILVSH